MGDGRERGQLRAKHHVIKVFSVRCSSNEIPEEEKNNNSTLMDPQTKFSWWHSKIQDTCCVQTELACEDNVLICPLTLSSVCTSFCHKHNHCYQYQGTGRWDVLHEFLAAIPASFIHKNNTRTIFLAPASGCLVEYLYSSSGASRKHSTPTRHLVVFSGDAVWTGFLLLFKHT